MKKSGVRFGHYSGYRFVNEKGEYAVYRAISEETAARRCEKEFPENRWTLEKVFDYEPRYELEMYFVTSGAEQRELQEN